jgi:hypothetical protein
MGRNANTAPCETSPPGQGVDPRNELVAQRSSVYAMQIFTISAGTSGAVLHSEEPTQHFSVRLCSGQILVALVTEGLRVTSTPSFGG